jgi:hypothetical protein
VDDITREVDDVEKLTVIIAKNKVTAPVMQSEFSPGTRSMFGGGSAYSIICRSYLINIQREILIEINAKM